MHYPEERRESDRTPVETGYWILRDILLPYLYMRFCFVLNKALIAKGAELEAAYSYEGRTTLILAVVNCQLPMVEVRLYLEFLLKLNPWK